MEFRNSKTQKPGDHPNFRKNALGARRVPGHSQSNSRNSEADVSQNAKFHSRNGISRLEQYENHNSPSNSQRDSRNDGHPHEKCSFAPAFSERFFKNWGGPRAQEKQKYRVNFVLQQCGSVVGRGAGLLRRQMRMFMLEVVLSCPDFLPCNLGVIPLKKKKRGKEPSVQEESLGPVRNPEPRSEV